MSVEDRIREAMRERAATVRSVRDRWSEVEEGAARAQIPRRAPSGRRALAAAVAFAVSAASAVLVWSAFRPSDGPTADDGDVANYVLEDVRIDGPSIDPRTGQVLEGSVDVGFRVAWDGDIFPGVHTCTWTVFDGEGSVVGEASTEVVALSPDNARTPERVDVTGEGVSASAECDPARLDALLAYDVVDASVLPLLGSNVTVRWKVRWPDTLTEGDWPAPNDCTVTVLTGSGQPLASGTASVSPGPTLPTSFETPVELGAAAADLSQADRDGLTASVACVPFTGGRVAVASPTPEGGSANPERLCGGESATIVPEPGAIEVTGTAGNDRVILPEGAGYVSNGGVDLLCAPDGTVMATIVPEGITVAVYNASNRPGLASALADQLQTQGFEIGDVGDAPSRLSSVVYFRTPEARPVAEYVASLIAVDHGDRDAEASVEAAPAGVFVPDRDAEVVVLLAGVSIW